MRQHFTDLLRMAHRALDESAVTPDEKVVIFTDDFKNPTAVDAFHAACATRVSDVVVVTAPTAERMLMEPPPTTVQAMIEADFVLDMATWFWTYTKSVNAILESGTRILQVYGDGIAVLDRPANETVSRRVEWVTDELVGKSSRVRMSSTDGTAFECGIDAARNVFSQDGRAEVPGDWDSIGTGMVNFAPPETDARGTLVVDGTLFLPPEYAGPVKERIAMEVEEGRIVRIDRSTREGRLMDDYMSSWDDPSVYVISHVGVGLDHRATLGDDDLCGWESHMGSALVAFGANTITRFSGRNPSPTHVDTTLIGCDMWFDERQVLDSGQLLPPELA